MRIKQKRVRMKTSQNKTTVKNRRLMSKQKQFNNNKPKLIKTERD